MSGNIRDMAEDPSNECSGVTKRADVRCRGVKRGPPAKSDRASSIEMSKTDMASFRWSGGHEWRTNNTFGRDRQDRKRAVSIWESCKSRSRCKMSCTFLTRPAIALLPHKRTKGQWETLGGQNHLLQWEFQLEEDCSQGCNLLGCEEETSPCSGTDLWQAQLPQ